MAVGDFGDININMDDFDEIMDHSVEQYYESVEYERRQEEIELEYSAKRKAESDYLLYNPIFDGRLIRSISIYKKGRVPSDDDSFNFMTIPYYDTDSYIMDYNETPVALRNAIIELQAMKAKTSEGNASEDATGQSIDEGKIDREIKILQEQYKYFET